VRKTPVQVSVSELEEILDRYLGSSDQLNYALKIVGHPGVGKSAIVRDAAARKNYLFIDTRLAFKENIDLGGYPVPDHEARRMVYYRPRFIPPEQVPEGYDGIVWFLDEANRAHPTVIQTLFQIITEHTCGEHPLSAGTFIILAGNLGDEDDTTITNFDDSALDGRLSILQLRPTAHEWLKWADRNTIHPSVIRYIKLFPDRLWDEKNINPNPRGWHQVSLAIRSSYGLESEKDLVDDLTRLPDHTLNRIIPSLLSETVGSDFIAQQTAPRQLSEADIITGSKEALASLKAGKIPAEDFLWGLSGAIDTFRQQAAAIQGELSKSDRTDLSNILTFIGHARPDACISFFHMLIRECGVLTQIPLALKSIEDQTVSEALLSRFTAILGQEHN
jgi:hypothetical protein